MDSKPNETDGWPIWLAAWIVIVLGIIVALNWNSIMTITGYSNEKRTPESSELREEEAVMRPPESPDSNEESAPVSSGGCEDVTSYDYNWDNDMLCTRPDGSEFYTDYSGAAAYESTLN